jgi:hypothetical protein
MAQKTTLTSYLARRGVKAKALTRGEAELLGIPYPLQGGWPRKYGAMEIDDALIARLAAHAEAARRVAEERLRSNRVKPNTTAPVQDQLSLVTAPARVRVSPVPGFVLRRPKRYRSRSSAPWA